MYSVDFKNHYYIVEYEHHPQYFKTGNLGYPYFLNTGLEFPAPLNIDTTSDTTFVYFWSGHFRVKYRYNTQFKEDLHPFALSSKSINQLVDTSIKFRWGAIFTQYSYLRNMWDTANYYRARQPFRKLSETPVPYPNANNIIKTQKLFKAVGNEKTFIINTKNYVDSSLFIQSICDIPNLRFQYDNLRLKLGFKEVIKQTAAYYFHIKLYEVVPPSPPRRVLSLSPCPVPLRVDAGPYQDSAVWYTPTDTLVPIAKGRYAYISQPGTYYIQRNIATYRRLYRDSVVILPSQYTSLPRLRKSIRVNIINSAPILSCNSNRILATRSFQYALYDSTTGKYGALPPDWRINYALTLGIDSLLHTEDTTAVDYDKINQLLNTYPELRLQVRAWPDYLVPYCGDLSTDKYVQPLPLPIVSLSIDSTIKSQYQIDSLLCQGKLLSYISITGADSALLPLLQDSSYWDYKLEYANDSTSYTTVGDKAINNLLSAGYYRITLTGKQQQCKLKISSSTIHIGSKTGQSKYLCNCDLYTPNSFTPAPPNDLINDAWLPIPNPNCTKYGKLEPRTCLLNIFDRWGNIVYHSNNWQDITTIGWNGNTPNNNPCPEGVYMYQLYISWQGGFGVQTKNGNITLIRR